MTADTTRSNVLYLFQAEGAKELGNHIQACLEIKQDTDAGGDEPSSAIIDRENFVSGGKSALPDSALKEDDDLGNSMKKTSLFGHKKQKGYLGLQKMITPVFNVI